jgi:hypothetical protein
MFFLLYSYWLSAQDTMEMTANQDPPLAGHAKKRKKTVSYCLSVPVEKSPLGKDRFEEKASKFSISSNLYFLNLVDKAKLPAKKVYFYTKIMFFKGTTSKIL